ncbi:FecR family protein [Flavobacterium terrisoli]|uniref:FecR family protein n=1 Tax=Flavobacterium terrisoli TaxID=3242195 RepID=UPI002542E622|nr:FecR family protein [Flavobacterium buctense]
MEEDYKLAKWLAGEMTEEELAEFRAQPDFAIYENIKKYSSKLETSHFDEDKSLAVVLAAPKKEIKTISLTQNWFFRIAAVLVLGLGLFLGYQNFATSTEYAENGIQNTFTLPDDSEVVLNSGSKIEYNKWNWDNHRRLELNGEAYFKVAKGKKFEVHTSLGKVTVLGTQFNVKQRDNRFDVTCYEGKVKVNYQDKEVLITRGMSVVFEDGKSISIPENLVQSPEWLNNEMVFYQEDLKSIIGEFERRFNVTLELESSDNSQLFTGTIPAENIDIALQILATTYHLKPTKVSKNRIILKSVDAQK